MELKVKLYLTDDNGEKFMGIGVLWLLEKTDELGSLLKAAIAMTSSYTKAYNMRKRLEEERGLAVLERKKGGVSRDGACLTAFGKELVKLYRTFQLEAKERVMEPYNEFCSALKEKMDEYDNG